MQRAEEQTAQAVQARERLRASGWAEAPAAVWGWADDARSHQGAGARMSEVQQMGRWEDDQEEEAIPPRQPRDRVGEGRGRRRVLYADGALGTAQRAGDWLDAAAERIALAAAPNATQRTARATRALVKGGLVLGALTLLKGVASAAYGAVALAVACGVALNAWLAVSARDGAARAPPPAADLRGRRTPPPAREAQGYDYVPQPQRARSQSRAPSAAEAWTYAEGPRGAQSAGAAPAAAAAGLSYATWLSESDEGDAISEHEGAGVGDGTSWSDVGGSDLGTRSRSEGGGWTSSDNGNEGGRDLFDGIGDGEGYGDGGDGSSVAEELRSTSASAANALRSALEDGRDAAETAVSAAESAAKSAAAAATAAADAAPDADTVVRDATSAVSATVEFWKGRFAERFDGLGGGADVGGAGGDLDFDYRADDWAPGEGDKRGGQSGAEGSSGKAGR